MAIFHSYVCHYQRVAVALFFLGGGNSSTVRGWQDRVDTSWMSQTRWPKTSRCTRRRSLPQWLRTLGRSCFVFFKTATWISSHCTLHTLCDLHSFGFVGFSCFLFNVHLDLICNINGWSSKSNESKVQRKSFGPLIWYLGVYYKP